MLKMGHKYFFFKLIIFFPPRVLFKVLCRDTLNLFQMKRLNSDEFEIKLDNSKSYMKNERKRKKTIASHPLIRTY